MKFYLKRFIIVLCIGVTCFICWNLYDYDNKHEIAVNENKSHLNANAFTNQLMSLSVNHKKYDNIQCLINDDYEIQCIKSIDNDVYIPFSFIKKYFEIDGKLVANNGKEVLNWQHSYSKVIYPKQTYDSNGLFLWFDNYNVESRDRVKCVSGVNGVPISTQWYSSGHYYPIQIAQFGLSHFTKNITTTGKTIIDLGLGLGDRLNHTLIQHIIPHNSIYNRITDEKNSNNKVIYIDGKNIVLKFKSKTFSGINLSFDVKPLTNFSLIAVLKTDFNSLTEYSITYSTINDPILIVSSNIIYGIGTIFNKWNSYTRDLAVDLQKGFTISRKKMTVKARNLHLIRIELNGKALLDNLKLSSSAHEFHVKSAADWFVNNQDESGGWPIRVNRKLSNGALSLKSGWYSAMAQGQAISLLTRMYKHTNNYKYFDCAKKALHLFDIESKHNGIKTYFMDKYVWFEEYPTIPSSFVLNGFIYSLFGLYDLKMSCDDDICLKADKLYKNGLISLEKLLPLFDSGSGSMYDLRHLGLGTAPNIARWDYHTTHINQLLFLNTIENNVVFQDTAKRWISYMKGNRAPHN